MRWTGRYQGACLASIRVTGLTPDAVHERTPIRGSEARNFGRALGGVPGEVRRYERIGASEAPLEKSDGVRPTQREHRLERRRATMQEQERP